MSIFLSPSREHLYLAQKGHFYTSQTTRTTSIDKINHFGYTHIVESLGAPLTQRLGIYIGNKVSEFFVLPASHAVANGRQDPLDRPLEQDLIAFYVHAGRIWLFQRIPGSHPQLTARIQYAHPLLRAYGFPSCFYLARHPCHRVDFVVVPAIHHLHRSPFHHSRSHPRQCRADRLQPYHQQPVPGSYCNLRSTE